MKQGNQFYLKFRCKDKDGTVLTPELVDKVQFNIGNLTKEYSDDSSDVVYIPSDQTFLVWLSEDETFDFDNFTNFDVRAYFKNNVILGSVISQMFFFDSLRREKLDVK